MNPPILFHSCVVRMVQSSCLLLLLLLLTNSIVGASVSIHGYWAADPLNGIDVAYGTVAQQTSPTTNPNVFCEMQGNNIRLPQAGEMNIAYLGKPPMTGNTDTMNGAVYSTRKTGSLVSEWGAQPSLYNTGSGWYGTNYWVAEPYNAEYRHRVSLISPTSGILNNTRAESKVAVVCVRSL